MTQQGSDGCSTADIIDAAQALGVLNSSAHAAPQILATLCREGVGPREVAQVIGGEPGLTARVLRVANSAFYGQSRSVATIERAVVVLGLDAVRGVAAAACLDRAIARGAGAGPLAMAELLRHSVATAAAAQAAAQLAAPALAGEAFIAGLLHDFGVPLQLRLGYDAFRLVAADLGAAPAGNVRDAERAHGLVGHERCAAVIFEAWRLPPDLVDAVRHHHDPAGAAAGHRALAALVGLADHLSLAAGLGFATEPPPGPAPDRLLALLDLDGAALAPLVAALPETVRELQAALYGG